MSKFGTEADYFTGIVKLLTKLDILVNWEIHYKGCLVAVYTRNGSWRHANYDKIVNS